MAPDLIPEFERVIGEAAPTWFVMENVPDAPMPYVAGYDVYGQILADTWVGGQTSRRRRFSFGGLSIDRVRLMSDGPLLAHPNPRPAICASGSTWVPVRIGGSGKRKGRLWGDKSSHFLAEALPAQGLPPDFLAEAPFTVRAKIKAIGNGVPIPMGRAIARAVKRALGLDDAAKAQTERGR